MAVDRFLTNLADRMLTDRFLIWRHLVPNYTLLALAMIVYLVFGTSTLVIALAALPGAIMFLVTLYLYAYRYGTLILEQWIAMRGF